MAIISTCCSPSAVIITGQLNFLNVIDVITAAHAKILSLTKLTKSQFSSYGIFDDALKYFSRLQYLADLNLSCRGYEKPNANGGLIISGS